MSARRGPLGTAAAAALGALATACGPAPEPAPPPAAAGASIRFVAIGDLPYDRDEEMRFLQLVEDVNAVAPDWVVHVGDILGTRCSDRILLSRRQTFARFEMPFVYTPGDNDWTDCHARSSGGYEPLERLARLREIFFAGPAAAVALTLPGASSDEGSSSPEAPARQSSTPGFEPFVENVRWVADRVVFATIHVVGSRNGLKPFAGRTRADDEEVARREAAALAWVSAAFAEARRREASAVVLFWHAAPGFEHPPGTPYRAPFERLLTRLTEEVAAFGRPVLLVHGDDHDYLVDRPLADPASGEALATLTRLQVPGSHDVAWVEVFVSPGAPEPFAFVRHDVRHDLRWLRRFVGWSG